MRRRRDLSGGSKEPNVSNDSKVTTVGEMRPAACAMGNRPGETRWIHSRSSPMEGSSGNQLLQMEPIIPHGMDCFGVRMWILPQVVPRNVSLKLTATGKQERPNVAGVGQEPPRPPPLQEVESPGCQDDTGLGQYSNQSFNGCQVRLTSTIAENMHGQHSLDAMMTIPGLTHHFVQESVSWKYSPYDVGAGNLLIICHTCRVLGRGPDSSKFIEKGSNRLGHNLPCFGLTKMSVVFQSIVEGGIPSQQSCPVQL